MSYADIASAFRVITISKKTMISPYQLSCLENSLAADLLLSAQYELFCPIDPPIKKMITQAIERRRLDNADQDNDLLEVHSPLLGGSRSKTKTWLASSYPNDGELPSYLKILEMIPIQLQTHKYDHMLEQAEHSRAQERTREFDLSQTPATIEEIHNDFKDYLDYLKDHAEKGGTYGLKALLSIHQWVIAQEEGEQRADAWETLIRALDDSRTAYHIYPNKFVEGKDYSCSQGYEERLLDAISPIRELIEDALQLPPSESFIPDLASPYITENIDGTRRASDFLYGAYCLAAGYRIEETTRQKWTLSAKETAPAYQESLALWKKTNAQDILLKQSLKQRYRSTLGAQEFHEEAFEDWKKAPSAASADGKTHEELFWTEHFKSYLAILCTEERDLTEQEQSWKITALVELNTIQELSLIAAEIEISDEQALKSLIEYAGFINEAHRDFVLAILQEGVEELKIRASLEEVVPPRFQPELPEEMSQKMDDWALVQGYWSFPAISEESESALLKHIQGLGLFSAPPCSESALITLLSQNRVDLAEAQSKNLLFSCIRAGYAKTTVQALITAGVDINVPNRRRIALIEAAVLGHTEMVRVLVEAGADTGLTDSIERIALIEAAKNGHEKIVKILLDAHANVNEEDNERSTALIEAAKNGHAKIVQILVDAKADVNVYNSQKNTALIEAARNGHTEIARILIDAGADLLIQNRAQETAKSSALEKGYSDIVLIINKKEVSNAIAHTININARPSITNTLFHGVSASTVLTPESGITPSSGIGKK